MLAILHPSILSGEIQAPPSKSMAHRALICAGLARGESRVEGILPSQDMEATLRGLRALGAQARLEGTTAWVSGSGGNAPLASLGLDCGESGSTLRFLIPLFALSGDPVRFSGKGRLAQRPLAPYQALFQSQGLAFSQDEGGVSFQGPLRPGLYGLPGNVSSQFVSGLLFALPLLAGNSELRILPPFESRSYVDLTLDALSAFGVSAAFADEYTLAIPGGQAYRPHPCYRVEGDDSQAAFFMLAGAVLGGVCVTGLRPDSRQGDRVMADILTRCGTATARIAGAYMPIKSALKAVEIDLADCPDLGPILMVLGLFCRGETILCNAGRLRLKESDRGAAMAEELAKLGGRVRISADGETIRIQGGPLRQGPPLHSHGDHRIAMALAMAALCGGIRAEIQGADAVEKSYPSFWADLCGIGAQVELQ